jgi:hypothetical protein
MPMISPSAARRWSSSSTFSVSTMFHCVVGNFMGAP